MNNNIDLVNLILDTYYCAADLETSSSKKDDSLSTSSLSSSSSRSINTTSSGSHSTSSKLFTSGQNTVIHRANSSSQSSSGIATSFHSRISRSCSFESIPSRRESMIEEDLSDVEVDDNNHDESVISSTDATLVREFGHNLYILARKLAKFNKDLSVLLKPSSKQDYNNYNTTSATLAFSFYSSRTAQIEVRGNY